MRIAAISLHNWKRFKGKHLLDPIAGGVHAVVAKHDADAGRSNWLGKSSLIGAVRFALYGTHGSPTEDGWITHGETEGSVEVAFDDGTYVRRSRKLGKATQIEAQDSAGQKHHQAAAQAMLLKRLGLTETDFMATCFFEQKQMARLVTATPAERMEIVGSWLGLEKLQACEENVRNRLATLTQDRNRWGNDRSTLKSFIANVFERYQIAKLSELNALHTDATNNRMKLEAVVKQLELVEKGLSTYEYHRERAKEFDDVVARGKALKAELEAYDRTAIKEDATVAGASASAAQLALGEAQAERRRLDQAHRGEFDGKCPVAGIDCPARQQINAMGAELRAKLDTAIDDEKAVAQRAGTLANQAAEANRRLYEFEGKERKLVELRNEAMRLLNSREYMDGVQNVPDQAQRDQIHTKLNEQRTAMNELVVRERELKAAIDDVAKWENQVSACDSKLAALDARIAVHREALLIFGRNGAQKRVAERELSSIEAGANALLAASGIPLGIGVSWGREGKGLATFCDQCGTPYPASQRVKKCPACNAQRGPKVVERLDLVLTDYSGAAEDLAGVAFQLAASAWLRAERNSAWNVAFIDEPFGALDATNRKALSVHLAAMLSGRYGFEQAFIVAHDKGIMDALPQRIEIEANDEGSRL